MQTKTKPLPRIEEQPTGDQCLANVAKVGYESCGKKLNKHADGESYCPEHGMMH